MITSSGVPQDNFWSGAFAKAKFSSKFKVVDKVHDEIFDTYSIFIEFYAKPGRVYEFEVSESVYNGSKEDIASEVKEQLSNE